MEVAAGVEGRGFLLAEGRSTGRPSARYRAANFPRKRADGALVPEFRGVLETDDGAAILFEWNGLATLPDSGRRQLLGSLVHTTGDARYRWLNDRGPHSSRSHNRRRDAYYSRGFEVKDFDATAY